MVLGLILSSGYIHCLLLSTGSFCFYPAVQEHSSDWVGDTKLPVGKGVCVYACLIYGIQGIISRFTDPVQDKAPVNDTKLLFFTMTSHLY